MSKKYLSALFCGLLFGIGLSVSQMINPQKVLGFLDVTGQWDPSLALVMAGALTVAAILQHIILRRPAPLFAEQFPTFKNTAIDMPLVAGAAIFGIGWGLAGFCPGPAISALSSGIPESYVFTFAMFAGMWLYQLLHGQR